MAMHNPPHPGEFIATEYLAPLGSTSTLPEQSHLAASLQLIDQY